MSAVEKAGVFALSSGEVLVPSLLGAPGFASA